MRPLLLAFAAPALCATLVSAQDVVAPPAAWKVPVHSAGEVPDDDGRWLWAAGPRYKAAFGSGFAFYPALGLAYPDNLPLCWTATEVAAGGERWRADGATEVWHDDWRVEYRSAHVTERYDVRDDGVEQSFVLHGRPPRAGDLVVTGTIDTPLAAATRGPEHAGIVFHGPAGEPILRYGAAFAFDARGRRAKVASSWDGESIRLHVDGEFLAEAVWPVTIDPLTSTVLVDSGAGAILDSDVVWARPLAFTGGAHLVVFSRASAQSDVDSYGIRMVYDLSGPQTVWSQLSTVTSARRPRCTYMEPYWVIVWEGTSILGAPSVRAYVADRRLSSLNPGTATTLSAPAGSSFRRPDVGADASSIGLRCLVVFEEQASGNSEVRGALFYPLSNSFGSPFLLSTTGVGTTRERSSPSVSARMDLNHWIVAYEERLTSGSDDWDVYVNLVSRGGSISAQRVVGPANNSNENARFPFVDGLSGRYVVTYSGNDTANFQRRVGYQRIDWDAASGTFSAGAERTLATALLLSSSVGQYGVAVDEDTRSHWAIAYRVDDSMRAARVGFSGGVVESATLGQDANGIGAGAVAYAVDEPLLSGRFVFAWGETGVRSQPLRARYLRYPGSAFLFAFGDPGCGLSLSSNSAPYAGNGRFTLLISSAPANAATVLFAAPASVPPIPIPLAAPCTLSLPLQGLVFVEARLASPGGTASFALPLPDDPLFQGSVYFQGAALDPGFNTLGVSVTGGLGASVQ